MSALRGGRHWASGLLLLILDALHTFSGASGPEPAVHKGIQVAVHHRLDIAGFATGAEVLDHSVGLEDVAANLVAPGDAALFAVEPLHLGFLCVLALGE